MKSMTGRDLILYILEHNLENEEVFKDGKFVGFMTAAEYAIEKHIGMATVKTCVERGDIGGIKIGDEIFIPAIKK